jgi:uncharacterized membrane protein YgcG
VTVRAYSARATRAPSAGRCGSSSGVFRRRGSKDTPGAAYAWWVFNRSNPAGELRQASANRHLFLLVDTASRGAWLTVGYGLEPFVGTDQLRRCVERAQPFLERGEFAAGVAALLKEAEAVLRATVAALPRIYGLPPATHGAAPEPAAAW